MNLPWWFFLWTLSGLFWFECLVVAAILAVVGKVAGRPAVRWAAWLASALLLFSTASVYIYSWLGHPF